MDFSVISVGLVAKLLLLLLIGMGPKIALVPFLEKTKNFDAPTQRATGRQMVVVAVVTALILFAWRRSVDLRLAILSQRSAERRSYDLAYKCEVTHLFNRRYLESRLAYRIQELAYGGLKPETIRRLERLGEELDNGEGEHDDQRDAHDDPTARLGPEHEDEATRDGSRDLQGRR